MTDPNASVLSCVRQWNLIANPFNRLRTSGLTSASKRTPTTSEARQQASLADQPLELPLPQSQQPNSNEDAAQDPETVLYLGYGSNLSAETFRGKRQIRPLSQVNVVVPEISLSFDLPGIPYTEPCFGNCRHRIPTPPGTDEEKTNDYNKDHWRKGLVGVVYEVTKADFIHIIATEGGGSGYQDVLVDCFALSTNPRDKVPETPSGSSFKAHTLFAPERVNRPDHSYAQPSARYLKLITDGAAEHSLPYEYQDFLHQIRPYRLTTTKQRLGQWMFLLTWLPLFAVIFGGGGSIFLRPDGTYPPWFAALAKAIFKACWASYDDFFRKLFGDGERTIGDKSADDTDGDGNDSEKAPLVQESIKRYGIGGKLDGGSIV